MSLSSPRRTPWPPALEPEYPDFRANQLTLNPASCSRIGLGPLAGGGGPMGAPAWRVQLWREIAGASQGGYLGDTRGGLTS